MGYVDGGTMIKFKNKMVDKFNQVDEKIETVNKNLKNTFVACELNNNVHISNLNTTVRLFKNKKKYASRGDTYSIAVGQPKRGDNQVHNYQVNKNGNGVIASKNDYLHQRKKYLNYTFPSLHQNTPTLQNLLEFLFGTDILRDYFRTNMTIDSTKTFPGEGNQSRRSLRINLNVDYDVFMHALANDDTGNIQKYFLRYENQDQDTTFTRYKGKLYIVKNKFTRTGGSHTQFCEEVFGYLYLIISINRVDHFLTQIWISTLKDK